jgi:hypothetical protein
MSWVWEGGLVVWVGLDDLGLTGFLLGVLFDVSWMRDSTL